MRKLLFTFIGVLLFSFASFSQDMGKNVIKYIEECKACTEVVMTSAGLEKKYAGEWLNNISLEDGMLTFRKGTYVHRWNPEKIVFIERAGRLIRVFLEQAR